MKLTLKSAINIKVSSDRLIKNQKMMSDEVLLKVQEMKERHNKEVFTTNKSKYFKEKPQLLNDIALSLLNKKKYNTFIKKYPCVKNC
jgi:hypothetical protein